MTATPELVKALRLIAPIHAGRAQHECISEAADQLEQYQKNLSEAIRFWELHRSDAARLGVEVKNLTEQNAESMAYTNHTVDELHQLEGEVARLKKETLHGLPLERVRAILGAVIAGHDEICGGKDAPVLNDWCQYLLNEPLK